MNEFGDASLSHPKFVFYEVVDRELAHNFDVEIPRGVFRKDLALVESRKDRDNLVTWGLDIGL